MMETSPPKKLFYRIHEAAEIVGVEPYVLRYWETRFPMLAPEKDSGEQRRYTQDDLDVLLRIRELLHEQKYTVAGAVERMKEETAKATRGRRAKREVVPEDGGVVSGDGDEDGGTSAASRGRGASAPEGEGTRMDPDAIRKLRDELGLLKRELEAWREELGGP